MKRSTVPRRVPEKGYESVSLPVDLLDTVRKILKDHPQLGYTSLAEYVKEALRAKFRVDAAVALVLENKYGKGAPRLSDLKGKDAGAVYAEAI
jgi:hypothetical protein